MGCLFEVFFEIFIECIMELVLYVYLKIATVVVPNKEITEKTKKRVENNVKTVSLILVLILFIGALFLLADEEPFYTVGKYMTLVPLCVLGIQAALGISVLTVRIIKRRKDKEREI